MSKKDKSSITKSAILFGSACVVTASVVIAYNFRSLLPIFPSTTIRNVNYDIQYADPYVTLKHVLEGNKEGILVVDMRSAEDYKERRFNNTTNIYFPYETDREGEKKFVEQAEKASANFKKVVLLPYSSASTTGEDAARMLVESGISNVFVMKIGWNELYNLPGMWIPEEKASEFTISHLMKD